MRQALTYRPLLLAPLVTALLLSACAKKEEIFEGERFDVRTPLAEAIPDAGVEEGANADTPQNRSVALRLPKIQNRASWPQRASGPDHYPGHLSLGADLTRLWSANIGTGNTTRTRLSSEPVVAAGMVYTMDANSRVMAHSLIGAPVWSVDLTPGNDKAGEVSGGSLAFHEGVIYAGTGFGELVALSAADGTKRWTQKLNAPVTAAPTISGGTAYVVSRDNRAWAIRTSNGRVLWQQQSTSADAAIFGGASPAIAGRYVILPFSSGELVAALTKNGLRIWSVAVSGSRRGEGRSNIGDITGDPVVTSSRIYAANQAGRLTAMTRRDGERIWTATEGSLSPVLPIDNSVFLVSDKGQLIRLDARNGDVIWAEDLPRYGKEKKRRNAYTHFGPILAGGHLLVASSDGKLRRFDPVSGALVGEVDIPGGAASQPVVVDNVLYVLSQKGQLHAFK